MALVLEVIFKLLGYSLFFYGLWLTAGVHLKKNFLDIWYMKYRRYRQMKRLNYLNSHSEEEKKKSKLYEYLDLLLSSSSLRVKFSVSSFLALTLILFSVTSILLVFLIDNIIFSLIVGVFVGLIPYLLVLYRLESIRLKTSYSFINEFHVILQTYQGTNKNIYYVLLNTVENLSDISLKRLFRRLIVAFQKDRTDEDFKRSVTVFMYSIDSTFSQRFGNLIITAHLDDIDIGESLIDLNSDIVKRKNQLEEEKTEKLQTVLLGFAPIFVMPLVVYSAYKITGVVDFWYYFMKPDVLLMFIVGIILSVISILLSLLYRKPKTNL